MPRPTTRLTRPPLAFWARAEAARKEGLITWGALAYLRTLARLARARGDGRSFVLGERVIEEITGEHRRTVQRWRKQLQDAGLIAFDRRWSHKKGWFWLAKTTLIFAPSTGDKLSPVNEANLLATKCSQYTGDKMSPSLNGKKEPSVKVVGRRGKPRRVDAQQPGVAASPGATPHAPDAPTTGEKASKVKEAPPLGPAPAPAQTADGKGPGPVSPAEPHHAPHQVDPHRIIPPEEAARRIRELIAKLRHVARPDPTEPPETH
ncbi:MAG: helix-turn-helix domain-containing protein [Chloroflexaceae bacterium]|nr:helix-turn-helix domain-containing protein [Chloroflexaceae bacterium]